jgi:hypothetical protein
VKKRTGAPVTGTVAAAGTDNSLTLPRIIVFDRPVSPCIVTNHGATDEILVKVNVETKDATAVTEVFSQAAGLGHFVIPPKVTLADAAKDPPEGGECHKDVSCGGQIAVHSVSICTVGGDLDDVSVVGWDQ